MATPKMTRSHFQFIADALKWRKPDPTHLAEFDQWKGTVDEFARELCRTNPQFNPTKFREACGEC
jgi:hypothetical protein